MRLLFVEDSERLRRSVTDGMRKSGYAVDVAADGEDGLHLAMTGEYDVVVLDIMLPKIDGMEVLRRLRQAGQDVYVLLLTARDSVLDRVRGLRTGADDYLVKPFAFDELLARVDALARRRHNVKRPQLRLGAIQIDLAAKTVMRGTQQISLTPREYALLEYLALRAGAVVSRSEIEEHIYDMHAELMSNVVDSAVCALRRKLDSPGDGPSLIETRRGLGYIMRTEDKP